MSIRKKNSLIVIENGQLNTYDLDNKLIWNVGRPSKDNRPDIKLRSVTASRRHGSLQNIDGMWFYLDKNGKNGTVYNGKHITTGIGGRVKPITLKNGDVMIFGGGEEAVINSKTIWALFSEKDYGEDWRCEDTKGMDSLVLLSGHEAIRFDKPTKGTVIEKDNGIAIYMGDITYLVGDITVVA